MNILASKPLDRQQGSFYSTAIIVALFGIFLTAALKIAPAYVDHNVIVNAMTHISKEEGYKDMTIANIRTGVMKTVNTNNVNDFDAQKIQLVTQNGDEFVDITYEARVPLFFNISALVSFHDRYPKN